MAIIYAHVNKINNKKYVGITSYSDATQRWGIKGNNYKGSRFYEKGIAQFGWDSFEHIILNNEIDYDIAQQLEARLIKILNTDNEEFGYNEISGARIKLDDNLDVLADALVTKLSKTESDELLLETKYRYATNQYIVGYLNNLDKNNKINTDLDCQRGYVWTEDRQQDMWDTLLFGHRIPELHAVREGLKYEIIDGKQRLTTIMKIVNNEIPYKKNKAHPNTMALFNNESQIYFKDLPSYLQERILNTTINLAEYSDINDNDLVVLFRKLNAGMQLSEFSKGIANNIPMRSNFTRYIIKHNTMSKIFSEKEQMSSEDEKYLIRLAILLKEDKAISLTPINLERHYPSFTRKELLDYTELILQFLDEVNEHIEILSDFRSIKSYLPIISYVAIKNKLNNTQLKQFFHNIKNANYSGRGEDLSASIVRTRIDSLTSLLDN